jgi:hypothetical protein
MVLLSWLTSWNELSAGRQQNNYSVSLRKNDLLALSRCRGKGIGESRRRAARVQKKRFSLCSLPKKESGEMMLPCLIRRLALRKPICLIQNQESG